jgi:anti-sigma regulatory factor (Ser/Thr protein kinase)/ActR/RegA family two-component response regulator
MPRILVIGGDGALRSRLEAAGDLAGFEFVTAAGNVDAVRQTRTRAIDVVITDPDTPVLDDLALLDELRTSRPGLKAIVLAPAAAPSEIIEAIRSRVFACFVAPFDAGHVAEMTRRAADADDWRDGISVESGLPKWISLTVNCRHLTAERLIQFMTEHRRDLPEDDRHSLITAFREVLMNAMEHGAGFDPEKVVHVTAIRTDRAIVYYFRDPGTGFSPAELERSALSNRETDPIAHLERRASLGIRPGGFGMLVAKQIVDEMFYSERGNEVILIKRLE